MMKSRQERVGLFFVRAGQRPDRETQTEPCEHSELGGSHLVSIANSVAVPRAVGPLSLQLQFNIVHNYLIKKGALFSKGATHSKGASPYKRIQVVSP